MVLIRDEEREKKEKEDKYLPRWTRLVREELDNTYPSAGNGANIFSKDSTSNKLRSHLISYVGPNHRLL